MSLAFGTKVVVPLEMGMPSYRVDHYDPKINEDMAKISLDLLEEKRNIACIKLWHTKKGSPDNRRVKKKEFKKGDLVLRKVEVTIRHAFEGKLAPNWE